MRTIRFSAAARPVNCTGSVVVEQSLQTERARIRSSLAGRKNRTPHDRGRRCERSR